MLLNKLNDLRNQSDEEGFTLIELMIVVVIIGILAAIAIPIFANQQKESHKATVKSDVRNTVTGVATFLAQNPSSADLSTVPVTSSESDIISVSGTWDNYTVKGKTTSVEDWCLVFTSTTGEYTEASGSDCTFTASSGGSGGSGGSSTPPATPHVTYEFETGTHGWSNAGGATTAVMQTSELSHSGSYGLKVVGNGSGTGTASAHMDIPNSVRGDTYRLTAWVYLVSGSQTYLSASSMNGTVFTNLVTTTGSWQQVTMDYVGDVDGGKNVVFSVSDGDAFMDDVVITKLP